MELELWIKNHTHNFPWLSFGYAILCVSKLRIKMFFLCVFGGGGYSPNKAITNLLKKIFKQNFKRLGFLISLKFVCKFVLHFTSLQNLACRKLSRNTGTDLPFDYKLRSSSIFINTFVRLLSAWKIEAVLHFLKNLGRIHLSTNWG